MSEAGGAQALHRSSWYGSSTSFERKLLQSGAGLLDVIRLPVVALGVADQRGAFGILTRRLQGVVVFYDVG